MSWLQQPGLRISASVSGQIIQIIFERMLILPVCLNRKGLWLRSRDAAWHCIPLRARDRSSTSLLSRRRTPVFCLLFRVAYSVLRSRAEAEDVGQDVFVG